MCNSSGGSSSSRRAQEEQLALQREEIDRRRWEEDLRQSQINQGMNMINQNFWELDQTQPRPDWLRLPAPPDESFEDWQARTGGSESQSSAPEPEYRQGPRQSKIPVDSPSQPGTEQTGGPGDFMDPNHPAWPGPAGEGSGNSLPDDPFNLFDQRKQDYLDWATPQVSQQFGDASDQLLFRLHDMGHGAGSSTMINRQGRLQDDYTQARADTVDRGIDLANQAKQDVNAQRSNLINLLHQTGDPNAISGQMSRVIDSLRTPPSFNPIGPLFQNATAGLGSYLDGLRFGQMQAGVNQTPIYSSPGTSSGRVVR